MTITPPHQQIFCCSIFTDFFLSVNLAPNSYRFLKEPIYLCCYRLIFHPYWSFLVCWTYPSSYCVLWCLMFSLLACCYISPRGLFSCFFCIIVVSSSQATMQYWELFWSSVARWPNFRSSITKRLGTNKRWQKRGIRSWFASKIFQHNCPYWLRRL